MRSWRDELPSDIPREQMMAEAVRRGTARRRRRHRRQAALGGGAALLVTVMALVGLPLVSGTTGKSDVQVLGTAGAGSSAGSTQDPEPLGPTEEPTTTVAPTPAPEPTTTLAPAEPAPPPTTAPPPPTVAPPTTSRPPSPPQSTTTAPPPTSPAPAGEPGAPEFISATGNAATQRVIVRFTRPVVPGTAPLAPMYLVVHRAGDSTCSSPNGNAHEYLAGIGTDTITTDATSLVVGTTYISIASGFVKNAHDGTENARVVCVGIPVKG